MFLGELHNNNKGFWVPKWLQSVVNHTLWSGGHKFKSLLPLPLHGHVKKKKKKKKRLLEERIILFIC